jgi:hypothetical protein
MRTPLRPARRLSSAAAALALTAVALAGCSGSGDAGDSAAGGGSTQSEEMAVGGDKSAAAAQDSAAGVAGQPPQRQGSAAVAPAVLDRKLARRADISLTVKDVDAAAGRVRSIAASAQGLVLAEAISSEPDLPETGGYSTITISVPAASLDSTLDELAQLGTVHSRNATTDDVTAQYVDTESRVETMEASVDRVRALMSQATKLADIVALEAELSRRQADLEATKAQLAALDDATTLAPIEVRLSTDATVLEEAEDDTGFLAGLTAGWTAFTTSVGVVLTVLGALLPFAVVAAVVAVPLVLWLRRRGPRVSAPVTPAVGPPPAG